AIDPTELYERIARLGARDPWQVDLTQALLRLPIGSDEPLAAKAAALGTPAGDQLAAWLRTGGLPNPAYRVVTLHREQHRRYGWGYDHLPKQRIQVVAEPPEGFDDPFGLLTVPVVPIGTYYDGLAFPLWPTLLPHHRGLIAAYALPIVAGGADQDFRNVADILPLLAESSGDGGPALHLALTYGLGARHEADRVATLDALLMLAATGDLDAVAVGSHLGTLTAAGSFPLTRTIQPLRDAAAAGAPLSTWRLVAAALPTLLAAPTPPRGTVDLLTLAAETAAATGVSIEIPGLADIAARSGNSRLVTEAQRLAKALDTAEGR
ncbi:MAG TPA: hypothetical protein VFX61_15665, partial [Micromonosporaceae bacterium]|nr:hypothetical protein [Micromonosporaceae bacterium]